MVGSKSKNVSSRYQDFLVRFPLLANMLSSCIICVAGTCTSQVNLYCNVYGLIFLTMLCFFAFIMRQIISEGGELKFNQQEIMAMALIVTFFNTPILLMFFRYLSRTGYSVLMKLIIDQFIFSVPFNW